VVTENPLMIVPKYQKSAPFTTRENSPSVSMFIGRVKILMTGLINILNKVRHAPMIRATYSGSTTIPDIIFVVTKTEIERIIQCIIIFMIFIYRPNRQKLFFK